MAPKIIFTTSPNPLSAFLGDLLLDLRLELGDLLLDLLLEEERDEREDSLEEPRWLRSDCSTIGLTTPGDSDSELERERRRFFRFAPLANAGATTNRLNSSWGTGLDAFSFLGSNETIEGSVELD